MSTGKEESTTNKWDLEMWWFKASGGWVWAKKKKKLCLKDDKMQDQQLFDIFMAII